MSHRKSAIGVTLIVTLALLGSATTTMAQDEEPVMESLTGTLVQLVDEDGMTRYVLELEDGTQVPLSVGPPWYWTDEDPNPLADLLDDGIITLHGYWDEGPEESAEQPEFEVRGIGDGAPLWDTDAPPWSGGPAIVGPDHPGYEGWSKGQADAAEEEEGEDVELAGGPKVVGESHPGHKGWSRGQAAKEARGDNGERGRARAESRRGGPKVQGADHPGHGGWSKGQAARGGGAPDVEEDEGDV